MKLTPFLLERYPEGRTFKVELYEPQLKKPPSAGER